MRKSFKKEVSIMPNIRIGDALTRAGVNLKNGGKKAAEALDAGTRLPVVAPFVDGAVKVVTFTEATSGFAAVVSPNTTLTQKIIGGVQKDVL
jgi:hypothetical protein